MEYIYLRHFVILALFFIILVPIESYKWIPIITKNIKMYSKYMFHFLIL